MLMLPQSLIAPLIGMAKSPLASVMPVKPATLT